MAGAGGSRGGDSQQQQQGQGRGGGDLQQGQGGRLDFAPARDLEVNTSASRAQADKSTLKVEYSRHHHLSVTRSDKLWTRLRSTYPTEASTLSSSAMPPISRSISPPSRSP